MTEREILERLTPAQRVEYRSRQIRDGEVFMRDVAGVLIFVEPEDVTPAKLRPRSGHDIETTGDQ